MAAAIPRATPRRCRISSNWPRRSAPKACGRPADELDEAIREMIGDAGRGDRSTSRSIRPRIASR